MCGSFFCSFELCSSLIAICYLAFGIWHLFFVVLVVFLV